MKPDATNTFDSNFFNSLLPAVVDVARTAGYFIKDQLDQLATDDIEVKDFNSLVSFVDVEAEKKIVTGLTGLIDGATFVTEEETVFQKELSDIVWVIDPLDGTTNFIHQLPYFSVSIALRYKGEYVLGVVFDIMHDDMFEASVDFGARLNNKSISVSAETELGKAVFATGFPYNSFEWMERYLNLFREMFQKTRGIRRFGSAALDLCYVACGRFGGFYEYGLNEWDVAAGICIVREAGGMISDFQGRDKAVTSKTILASNGNHHAELLDILSRHFV